MGAILFAKRFSDFDKISRKAMRVVQYEGNNRMIMLKENIELKGYAIDFENLIKYIEALIPTQELIIEALREKKSAYPILAIREAVANALIHQDFSITRTGPVVEIFSNRIEIANAEMPYSNLSVEEKLWACYLHACIKQVQGEQLTNSSLRIRFGLKETSAGSISRLIKEAVEKELIKPLEPYTVPRYMKYIPIWA